jgi:hypothetical protein
MSGRSGASGRGGTRGGGGWFGGQPAAADVREVPDDVGAGGWSEHQLRGVFGAAALLEDEQRQQPDRTG